MISVTQLLSPNHGSSNQQLLPSNGMEAKRRWKISSRFWLPLFAFGALLYIMDAFQSRYNMIPGRLDTKEQLFEQDSLKGFLIKTPGCRIPYMDPFDHTIKEFISREEQPICNNGIPALFESNLTSIFLVKSSLKDYTDKSIKKLKCCYQSFYRAEPDDDEDDNKLKFAKKCIPFKVSTKITDEFIKVVCHENRSIIYTDFFSFVPNKIKKMKFESKPLNVLMIGLDAVSRVNLYRQMPKTVEYLKNISAVELLGYNKVGDNTFPNLMPVLTGLSEEELQNLCWKNSDDRFDECPFIWKDYKKKGFVTSFGEDASWMGIFNYERNGFKKQPTDYMWGYFNRISEETIGNANDMNADHCVGAREVYKVLLTSIQNFVTRMDLEQHSYFAFYWGASLSHDYLNKPRLGDKTYYKFFKKLKVNGHLNNTVLIFMSDHGIRWGDIRQTYQGQMEERLPFVFMVLPEWFKKQYQDAYNNLLKNTRRLTTPYDLHETLKDFLDPSILKQDLLNDRYQKESRGYSLFNVISPKRDCESADIASHWCTCQQSSEIDTNNITVIEAATFAVSFMNQQLEGYAQCANLSTNNITDARVMTHNHNISEITHVKDYTIIFETIPGNGVFEATLRNTVSDETNQFEVMGTISRLNLYGKQSVCITDFHLKLYCYCIDLLDFGGSRHT